MKEQLEQGAAELGTFSAGRYRLERELSRGGIGVVYRAHDLTTGHDVALKRLLPKRASEPVVLKLFEREYQTLRGLSHPCVIEVYDYGVGEDGPYYTMELLDGRDLHAAAPLPAALVCAHVRDVASSLAMLHARRLLHRDVSPRNVCVSANGRAKLIDFGSLASFGPIAHVLGTPPCMPPEALGAAFLDQRSDLYALGAVAYFALTGRHAYPARDISSLRHAWQQPVAPPSTLVTGIPPELDHLVLSLLSLDPHARPTSAGEVIIRLNEIIGQNTDASPAQAASYLLNPRLVGRDKELAALRAHAHQALAGHGRAVLVSGDEGAGKSRLLQEVLLECQLLGYCAVYGEGLAAQAPYALACSLVRALLGAAPALVRQTFAPQIAVLGHLIPELATVADEPLAPLPSDPAERRGRIQTAFIEALIACSRQAPIALGVDDLYALDSGSAAIVGGLSRRLHDARLLLLTSTQAKRAKETFAVLAADVVRVQLGNLARAETEALVRSLFGDVPDVARLAHRLHALSGGNPLLCMELAQHAVDRELVCFREGTWMVVQEPKNELPASFAESWSARLAALSADARKLIEVLCIEQRAIPIELCSALASELPSSALSRGLDELVAAGILLLSFGNYRFIHDSLRERALAPLPPERVRELHLRAAQVLHEASSARQDLHATWLSAEHLMKGGEELAGAERLADIAFDLLYGSDLLPLAAESFERAVAALERNACSPYRSLWLYVGLSAGWYLHPRYRLRYQDRVLELLGQITGLSLARKLRPWLGARLAVVTAVAWTSLRTRRARRHSPFADFKLVFTVLSRASTGLIASAGACMDVQAVRRILALLEPLSALGKRSLGGFSYDYCRKICSLIEGREYEVLPIARANIALLEDESALKGLPAQLRRSHLAGVHHTLGIAYALAADARALDCANVMASAGLALERSLSGQLRVLYFAARGEYDHVRAELERVEIEAIQGGSVWLNEVLLPIMLMTSYELAEDVVGLQHASESLRRWARVVPSLQLYDDAARLLKLIARGRAADALEEAERWVSRADPHERIGWAYGRAALLKVLNARGEYARARQEGERALAAMHPGDAEFSALYFEVERQLALSELGAGEHQAAKARLERLVMQHAAKDNPLHLGLLHEALAHVALAARDSDGLTRHYREVDRHLRKTGNPRLLQRIQRLADHQRAFGNSDPEHDDGDESHTVIQVECELELREAAANAGSVRERASGLLEVLLRRTRAVFGYLYAGDGDVLELLAAAGAPPTPAVLDQVRAVLWTQRESASGTGTRTMLVDSQNDTLPTDTANSHSRTQPVLVLPLYVRGDSGAGELTGALVLASGCDLPNAAALAAVAKEIRARPAPVRDAAPFYPA